MNRLNMNVLFSRLTNIIHVFLYFFAIARQPNALSYITKINTGDKGQSKMEDIRQHKSLKKKLRKNKLFFRFK